MFKEEKISGRHLGQKYESKQYVSGTPTEMKYDGRRMRFIVICIRRGTKGERMMGPKYCGTDGANHKPNHTQETMAKI